VTLQLFTGSEQAVDAGEIEWILRARGSSPFGGWVVMNCDQRLFNMSGPMLGALRAHPMIVAFPFVDVEDLLIECAGAKNM
jgi:hypothetical protein